MKERPAAAMPNSQKFQGSRRGFFCIPEEGEETSKAGIQIRTKEWTT